MLTKVHPASKEGNSCDECGNIIKTNHLLRLITGLRSSGHDGVSWGEQFNTFQENMLQAGLVLCKFFLHDFTLMQLQNLHLCSNLCDNFQFNMIRHRQYMVHLSSRRGQHKVTQLSRQQSCVWIDYAGCQSPNLRKHTVLKENFLFGLCNFAGMLPWQEMRPASTFPTFPFKGPCGPRWSHLVP